MTMPYKYRIIKKILNKYWEVILIVSIFFSLAEVFLLVGINLNIFLVIGILLITMPLWFLFWCWVTIKAFYKDFTKKEKDDNGNTLDY